MLEMKFYKNKLIIFGFTKVDPDLKLIIGDTTISILEESVSFDLQEYDFVYQDVSFQDGNGKHCLNYLFDKFKLDLLRLNDENYLNEVLFAAPTRQLKETEFFFQLINLIDKFSPDNKFLGGVITLINYRIAEDFEFLKCFIEFLLPLKTNYDESITLFDATSVRWYISSCSTFSTLLLLINKKKEAKLCLQRLWRNSCYFSSSEIIGWNHAVCMMQLGLILYDNDKRRSVAAFSSAFDICMNSITSLNTCRNNFLLFQTHDCEVLLKLSRNAVIALKALQSDSYIPEKFINIKISPKHRFDYKGLLKRFVCKSEPQYQSFYINVTNNINQKLVGG